MDHLNNRFNFTNGETNTDSQNASTGFKTDNILTFILILGGLFGLYYVPKTAFSQPSGKEEVNIRLTASKISKTQTAKLLPNGKRKYKRSSKRAESQAEKPSIQQLPLEVAVAGIQESGNRLEFHIQGYDEEQQYFIDFGNGIKEKVDSPIFEYTYNEQGSYEVKLESTQDNGEPEVSFSTVIQIDMPTLSSASDEKVKI